jgi:hypothetical protein
LPTVAAKRELKFAVLTVIADGFDGAFAENALAFFALHVRLRLLIDVGVTALVVAPKVVLRVVATDIAIYAVLIYVKPAGHVIPVAIFRVSQLHLLSTVTSDE